MSDGVVGYIETVVHPAFESDLQNSGEFILKPGNLLLRRQILPNNEEMEISGTSILIRRDGNEKSRPIPKRMRPYFSVLLAAISQKTAPQLDGLTGKIEISNGHWTLPLADGAYTNRALALSGCGTVLHSVTLFLKRGQQRHIVFVKP